MTVQHSLKIHNVTSEHHRSRYIKHIIVYPKHNLRSV